MNQRIKGLELKSWQVDAARTFSQLKSNDKFVILSPRQCGKSLLITQLLLYTALNKAKSVSICISPVNRQNGKLFDMMKSMVINSPLCVSANEGKMEIKFINGSTIIFLSAEAGDNIRGNTATGILVVDESVFIKDNMWAVILPFTNVSRCPIVLSSTPRHRSGYYYECYEKALSGTKHYYYLNASKYDLSYFRSEEMVEDYRKTLPLAFFKSEILGEFMDDDEGVFGDYSSCIGDPDNFDVVYAGIDWATVGTDSTQVVCFNDNKQMVKILSFNGKDPMEIVDSLALFFNSCSKLRSVQVESNSIGEVYFSALRRELHNQGILKKFNTTNTSKKEIIERLVEAFNRKEIRILDNTDLKFQLNNYTVKFLSKGNYTYNNFSDSQHDDLVMSLAICCNLFLGTKGKYVLI